jgi:hypothetical protein
MGENVLKRGHKFKFKFLKDAGQIKRIPLLD